MENWKDNSNIDSIFTFVKGKVKDLLLTAKGNFIPQQDRFYLLLPHQCIEAMGKAIDPCGISAVELFYQTWGNGKIVCTDISKPNPEIPLTMMNEITRHLMWSIPEGHGLIFTPPSRSLPMFLVVFKI